MTNIQTIKNQIGKRGYLNTDIYREAMINMRFEYISLMSKEEIDKHLDVLFKRGV